MPSKAAFRVALLLGTTLLAALPPTAGAAGPAGLTMTVTRFDDPPPSGCAASDCSLREAVLAANSNPGHDTVELASGIYELTIAGVDEDGGATGDLDVTDDLTLSGEGENDTIISANGIDRALHVRPVLNDVSVDISDLTVRGGHAQFTVGPESGAGAGLFVAPRVELTASRVTFRDGLADERGGGIYSEAGVLSGSLTLFECTIAGNQGSTAKGGVGGGGIYKRGEATLIRTTVRDNTAGFLPAGGIWNDSGPLTMIDSAVEGNSAGVAGGIANGGTLAIISTTIGGNTSSTSGGGINAGGEGVTITGSTISGNVAEQEGGGIDFSGDPGVTMTITNSTISGNTAGTKGGGIHNWVGGTVEMTNVTVSGNTTQETGGGLYIQSGAANLNNVTVANNTAPPGPNGSGIFNAAANVSLANTIVAGNGDGESCNTAMVSAGHNLEDGDTCGFARAGDLANTDPLLGPLEDDGGPTLTHSLLGGSPAIDAGNDASCAATDQRGISRPIDGDGDGDAVCDIGGYEAETSLADGDVDCNGRADAIDAALVLQYEARLILVLACQEAGDVNVDGVLNALDALLILQRDAGLIAGLRAVMPA